MMSRTVVCVVCVVVGLLILAAALLFTFDTVEPSDDPMVEAGGPAAIESVGSPSLPVSPEIPAVVRVEEAAALAGPPAAYVQQLGGLTGRIVDSVLAPLPGLRIELMGGNVLDLLPSDQSWFTDVAPDLDFVVAETSTDDDGRFRFEQVDPHGLYALAIDIQGPRAAYRLVDRPPEPRQLVDLGDIVLDPFVTLVGRVVDEDGKPVESARVRASDVPAEVMTFGLGDLRPGCAVAVKIPPSLDWLVLPVPALVDGLLARLPYHQTLTDEEGRFRLPGVPIGTVTVLVDRTGYQSTHRGPMPTGNEGDKNLPDLTLPWGERLLGQVVDGEDLPVGGVSILTGTPLPFFPVALMVPRGKTDGDGRFDVPGLTGAAHAVAVLPPERSRHQVVDEVYPGVDEPVIRLEQAWSLKVTAQDAEGTVVPGPKVLVQMANEFFDSLVMAPPLGLRMKPQGDGTVKVLGLTRGNYNVRVFASGYAAALAEVEIADQAEELRITLAKEVRGTVQVVDAGSGAPVEYALVSVYGIKEGGDNENPFDLAPLLTRRTDRSGVALLPGLLAGEQVVRVFHPLYAMAEAELVSPGPPVQVELRGGGSLVGQVLKDGQPVTTPHWVFALPSGEDEMKLPRITRTTDGGEYRFGHMRPGLYGVQVTERLETSGGGPQGRGGSAGFTISTDHRESSEEGGEEQGGRQGGARVGTSVIGSGDPDPGRMARITEGNETRLDIDMLRLGGDVPRGRLLGRVTLNGAAAADLRVRADAVASGKTLRQVQTNSAGVFDLGEIPAGEVLVRVARIVGESSYDLAVRTISVEASDIEDVEFRIETGRMLGTVVAAASGAAVPFATLKLLAAGGDDGRSEGVRGGEQVTASDEDGSFEFPVVPEGDWLLVAERNGFARTTVGPISVPKRRAPPAVRVRMASAVDVAGRIELPQEAGEAPYLFVHFSGVKDDGAPDIGGFAFVEPDSRTFEVKGLAPGDYRASIFGTPRDLIPVEVSVPIHGLRNAVLRPEVAPESIDAPVDVAEEADDSSN